MTRYTEVDFDRLEERAAHWRTLIDSDIWQELERDRRIMLYAWGQSLRTEDSNTYTRTQGMIRGAEVVLGYARDKILEIELLIEEMRKHNEGMDVEVEDAVD